MIITISRASTGRSHAVSSVEEIAVGQVFADGRICR
jgi:hypothetical protein